MHGPEIAAIPSWLRESVDQDRKDEVFKLGLITGLREKRGRYYTPNFERGLILDRLCEILRPEAILEIGTGRRQWPSSPMVSPTGPSLRSMDTAWCSCTIRRVSLHCIQAGSGGGESSAGFYIVALPRKLSPSLRSTIRLDL